MQLYLNPSISLMGGRPLMWLNSRVFLIVTLSLITALSFALRFVNIDKSPPGFLWDEASFGYNAYSLLKTGKDEYGQSFPLLFKAFGEYKQGVYVYLTVPFVAIFGLNETATRLPSIIIGSLIPLLGFLLGKEMVAKNQQKIPLFIALLLAISPWTIHFSRGAWETNLAFFETLLAVLLFLKSRSGKLTLLTLSILIFSLTIYTYSSSKMISSLLLFGLTVTFRDNFRSSQRRFLLIGGLIFFGLVLVSSMANTQVRSRLVYLNQLSYPRKPEEVEAIKEQENFNTPFVFDFFHPQALEYIKTILGRYLNYFSPKFLFADGAPDLRQGLIGYGMMHPFELPFLIFGFYLLLSRNFPNKKVLLVWALISPIPAALSRDSVSSLRSLPLVFALEFIVAVGMVGVLEKFKKTKALIILTLLILGGLNLGYFWDQLMSHNLIYARDWLPTYKEAITYLTDNQQNYQRVVFTNYYKEPYIFYLFYNKYPPQDFAKQAKLVTAHPPEVGEVEKVDNIEFVEADWHKYRFLKNTLIIGTDLELPSKEIDGSQADLLKIFTNLDGSIALKAVVTK